MNGSHKVDTNQESAIIDCSTARHESCLFDVGSSEHTFDSAHLLFETAGLWRPTCPLAISSESC